MRPRRKPTSRRARRGLVPSPHSYCISTLSKDTPNITYLISRLMPTSIEAFPFERALSLYLLFLEALWPGDRDRLLTGARIFAGSLNFHITATNPEAVFEFQNERLLFHDEFTKGKLAIFNKTFFNEIGGLNSLFITESVAKFYSDLLQRVTELEMMHDVVRFLIMASVLSPRLGSSRIAFAAIEKNIFKHPDGYRIRSGPKRKRSRKHATTVNSVREKWKRAPETILLSYLMIEFFGLQSFSPADKQFLPYLHMRGGRTPGLSIDRILHVVQAYLVRNRPTQNTSIAKWTRLLNSQPFHGLIGGGLRFSDDQLEDVFRICDEVFSKPLPEEEKAEFRQRNKTFSTINVTV